MIVFFSCGNALNEIGFASQTVEIDAVTPRQLIETLEIRQAGWRARLLQIDGSLRSDVALFTNIVLHANDRLLDGNATRALRSLDETFQHDDVNLLISLFRPDEIVRFLLDNLAGEAPSDSSARNPQSRALSPSWAEHNGQTLFARADPEPIYAFTQGRPVAELLTRERICVEFNQLLPEVLARALAVVLDASPDLNQFRLRAFQEDVLRHVLEQLGRDEEELSAQPLLLSIPTGGGKTEAFLAPLLARLLDERLHALQSGRTPMPTVKAMIVYPTRALANDQARRLAQILFEVNAQAVLQSPLALGVLTGDTPQSHRQLSAETSLLQLCPRCGAVLTQFGLSDNAEQVPLSIARCGCGAEIDCFRFTREDILTQPPDILVISPDMISRTLQLPHFNSRLFTPQLRAIVFDEIHSYSGVFGCHVAHLLRRVEAACGAKPLYLGVSATIRNAREVACALFDVAAQNVRYLRPKTQDEIETSEKRAYLNYDAGPARYRHHYAIAPGRVAGGRFAQTWGKRRSRKAAGSAANQTEPVLIERAVPSIVDAELWARAQETLRRNRLCRPDIVKRKYLLRGLMKCAHCGLTYVGTVSEGRKLDRVPESQRAGLEVRGGLVLRKYYLCNGKNGSHQSYGKLDARCTSGHIRALELENLVWADIAGFLREPGEVLERLRVELHSRGADPAKAKSELDRLEKMVAGHDEQRATLYRLFRRGAMTESDLEAQIAEICAEAGALIDERERLKGEWERARNSQGALESAEQLLERLRLKLDATGEGELSWEIKRRIVEELVAGIEVESLFDANAPRGKQRTAVVRITYRFEAPDAAKTARGGRNNGTAAASAKTEEISASALSLAKTHHIHSAPSAATDKATLPEAVVC